MALSTWPACLSVEARKNTQATTTATNVRNRFSHTDLGVKPFLRATACTDW